MLSSIPTLSLLLAASVINASPAAVMRESPASVFDKTLEARQDGGLVSFPVDVYSLDILHLLILKSIFRIVLLALLNALQ